jgi:hypothetical protein
METFGTSTDAVNGIIERAANLTAEEAEKLEAAWAGSCGPAWDTAWDTAWDAALDAALEAEWDAADAWNAAGDAAWYAAWDAAGGHRSTPAWVAARLAAGDAAQAAVVRDLISDEHYRTLAGAWESVMGSVFPSDTGAPPRY